jgi:hypothetical protein
VQNISERVLKKAGFFVSIVNLVTASSELDTNRLKKLPPIIIRFTVTNEVARLEAVRLLDKALSIRLVSWLPIRMGSTQYSRLGPLGTAGSFFNCRSMGSRSEADEPQVHRLPGRRILWPDINHLVASLGDFELPEFDNFERAPIARGIDSF